MSRILTGFPCSAEQECVSHVSIRSRICHKISRFSILTTQIGWLSVYYLNAAHWAISGIEVGNDCPKRNLTVISQRSVQGGIHRPKFSGFPFAFAPGLPCAACFSVSSPLFSVGTVPSASQFPLQFGAALLPGIWVPESDLLS